MTADEIRDDEYVDLLLTEQLVAHYLIHCFLYYQCEVSLIPDSLFDRLARRLDAEWGAIKHPHKKLIDRQALKSGGSYLVGKFPRIVRGTAAQLWIACGKPES